MDAQTSFIPKRTLDTQPRIVRADTVSIFTVLSTLIFFLTLIAGGGIFFWQKTLTTQVKEVEDTLIKERERFSEDVIQELADLSNRLQGSKMLLENRLYTSKIFELLNQNTIKTVRFGKFSIDPALVDKTKLKMMVSGQAKDYASVALQSEVFSKLDTAVIDYEFSNLTLDQSGNVLFDMSATIDKRAVGFDAVLETIDYSQSLANQNIRRSDEIPVGEEFSEEEYEEYEDEFPNN
jgi:hypothetical protein